MNVAAGGGGTDRHTTWAWVGVRNHGGTTILQPHYMLYPHYHHHHHHLSPSSPSPSPPPQDAYQLAEKLVTTYGLSDAGISSFAPPYLEPGSNRPSYGVGLYDVDDELFGRNAPANLMAPSDSARDKYKRMTLQLVLQAYEDTLVRGLFFLTKRGTWCTVSLRCTLASLTPACHNNTEADL